MTASHNREVRKFEKGHGDQQSDLNVRKWDVGWKAKGIGIILPGEE